MRDVVLEMMSGQLDIEVMAEVQDDSKIIDLVGDLRPDWLVIALDESDNKPHICDPLLDRYPHLKILALAQDTPALISQVALENKAAICDRTLSIFVGIYGSQTGERLEFHVNRRHLHWRQHRGKNRAPDERSNLYAVVPGQKPACRACFETCR